MPGSLDFAVIVLVIALLVTIFGGIVAGPQRVVPTLVFLSPLLLPAGATLKLPGIPDLSRGTVVGFGILPLLFFTPRDRIANFRFSLCDVLLIGYVLWAANCVLQNQGPWAAQSSLVRGVVALLLPYFAGRLYLQTAEDLRRMAYTATVCVLALLPLVLFEARMGPRFAWWFYGLAPQVNYRFGVARPVLFTAHGLEFAYFMGLVFVLLIAVQRSGGLQDFRQTRILQFGAWSTAFAILLSMARGPITGLVLALLAPLALRRTAVFSLMLALIGVCLFLWMLSPDGRPMDVAEFVAGQGEEGASASLHYRFLQIHVFKPLFEQSPIYGFGETWPRDEYMLIIDGLLLLTALGSGYPGVLLLTGCWCVGILQLRRPGSLTGTPVAALANAFAPFLGFMAFGAWGDSFFTPAHYLVLGGLTGSLMRHAALVPVDQGAWHTLRLLVTPRVQRPRGSLT